MANMIQTTLPEPSQPFSWATHANGTMYTTHGPVDSSGKIAGTDIEQQTRLTLDNLAAAVAAAGASLSDVAQVLIYMRDAQEMAAIDAIYREYFSRPYPNRSSVAVQGFVHPEMRIEIVAYVNLANRVATQAR